MTEEERRRCIILGTCQAGATREQALAEELAIGAGRSAECWQEYREVAAHLLRTFAFGLRHVQG